MNRNVAPLFQVPNSPGIITSLIRFYLFWKFGSSHSGSPSYKPMPIWGGVGGGEKANRRALKGKKLPLFSRAQPRLEHSRWGTFVKFAQLSGETRFSWFLQCVSFPKCLLTQRSGVCCSTNVSRTILVSSVLVIMGWKILNLLLAKNIWGVGTLRFPSPLFHLFILLCVYVFFIYWGEKYSWNLVRCCINMPQFLSFFLSENVYFWQMYKLKELLFL